MSKAKDTVRVSVDLPRREHEKLFQRCKFKMDNLSMNKRIIQLVQADNAGSIDVPHEPPKQPPPAAAGEGAGLTARPGRTRRA